jgi:hypothetical protein
VEEATPLEPLDLEWDLPTPSTVVDAVPMPASFPVTPPVVERAPVVEPPVVVVPPLVVEPPPVVEELRVVEESPAVEEPPVVEPPAVVEPLPVVEPSPTPVAPAPPTAVATPHSLANAFSALLAAEQAQPVSATIPSGSPMTEAEVEDVVRRVVARLTETGERLIREEIERLKR